MPTESTQTADRLIELLAESLAEQRAQRAILDDLLHAARSAPVTPQILSAEEAWTYCGISKTALYSLVSTGQLPQAVRLPGVGPRWKRADLERWVAKQKPTRRPLKVIADEAEWHTDRPPPARTSPAKDAAG